MRPSTAYRVWLPSWLGLLLLAVRAALAPEVLRRLTLPQAPHAPETR